MAGTGGFYSYHCRNYYDSNDPCYQFVQVNGAACATCLANSRDDLMPSQHTSRTVREIIVPRAIDGALHYTLMEVVETGDPNNYWILRLKAAQPKIPPDPFAGDMTPYVPPPPGPPIPLPF